MKDRKDQHTVLEIYIRSIVIQQVVSADLGAHVHLGGFNWVPFIQSFEHWIRRHWVLFSVTNSVPIFVVEFLEITIRKWKRKWKAINRTLVRNFPDSLAEITLKYCKNIVGQHIIRCTSLLQFQPSR